MLLATTIKAGLSVTYGDDGCRLVLEKLNQYGAVVSGSNALATAVLDDAGSMDQFGLPAFSAVDPSAITEALARVAHSGRLAQSLTDILIVGGDDVLPLWRVTNPVADRTVDPDNHVLTDSPYAALGSTARNDWLNPLVAIGRICPGQGATTDDFCRLIDLLIQNHQNRTPRSGSCALTNRQWQTASQTAAAMLDTPVRWLLSPDDRITASNAGDLDCRFLYCNLHGFDNDPGWKGYDTLQDRFVDALTPDAVSNDFVAGATVFTEACYGLQIAGKPASASCAVKFLAEGAAAVIGATGLAFGSYLEWQTKLLNADKLAAGFFDAATKGQNAGASLRAARTAFMGSASTPPNDYETKTLLQFCLLGDPSLA
jgi:hypothetical protein